MLKNTILMVLAVHLGAWLSTLSHHLEAAWPKSGDPEFKSRSDQKLDLFEVVPGSTPRLRLYIANWFASCQLEFLTC